MIPSARARVSSTCRVFDASTTHATVARAPAARATVARAPAARATVARAPALRTRVRSSAACAQSNSIVQEERRVLADTGANELIRPAGEGQPQRSCKEYLTLADGNTTFAYRTRDGELAIPGGESTWIAPIGKIVALGFRFEWDPEFGVRLIRGQGPDAEVIHMAVENGLPYMVWNDFAGIRRELSAKYRSTKRTRCAKMTILLHARFRERRIHSHCSLICHREKSLHRNF